jgi:hypothetical protein
VCVIGAVVPRIYLLIVMHTVCAQTTTTATPVTSAEVAQGQENLSDDSCDDSADSHEDDEQEECDESADEDGAFETSIPVCASRVFDQAVQPFEEVVLETGKRVAIYFTRSNISAAGWYVGTIEPIDLNARIVKYDVAFPEGVVENMNLTKRNYGNDKAWVCLK